MVSVLIPYKEPRKFLSEAIESVKRQRHVEVEILEGGGGTLGQNVNKLARQARGQFIKVLADDDVLWWANSLAVLTEALKRSGADWVHAGAVNFHGDGHIITQHAPKPVSLESMLEQNTIHGGTTLYRRRLWDRLGGWDETIESAEEYEWHLHLLHSGRVPYLLNAKVYGYRIHPGNKSRANLAHFVECGELSAEEIRNQWRDYKSQREPLINEIKNRYNGKI